MVLLRSLLHLGSLELCPLFTFAQPSIKYFVLAQHSSFSAPVLPFCSVPLCLHRHGAYAGRRPPPTKCQLSPHALAHCLVTFLMLGSGVRPLKAAHDLRTFVKEVPPVLLPVFAEIMGADWVVPRVHDQTREPHDQLLQYLNKAGLPLFWAKLDYGIRPLPH